MGESRDSDDTQWGSINARLTARGLENPPTVLHRLESSQTAGGWEAGGWEELLPPQPAPTDWQRVPLSPATRCSFVPRGCGRASSSLLDMLGISSSRLAVISCT